MRDILIGFFVVSFVAVLTNATFRPLPNSIRVRRDLFFSVKEPCKPEDKGIWRCKDCNTVQFCNNGNADFTLSCATQSPTKPYCYADDTVTELADKCVDDGKVCQGSSADFSCPGDGIYPSLTDCKSYFTCDQGTATQYMCLYGTVYNDSEKFCKLKATCYVVNADCGNQNKIIPYKQSNRLYVMCRADNSPILKECEENSVYNPALFRCEFKCPKEGIYADPESDKSFYRCFNDGKNILKEKEDCASGTKFDANKKYCVKSAAGGGSTDPGTQAPPTTTK